MFVPFYKFGLANGERLYICPDAEMKFGEWSSASELAIISEDGRGHGRAL